MVPVRFVRRIDVKPKISKLDGEFIDSIRKAREIECEDNTMEAIGNSFQEISFKDSLEVLRNGSYLR